MSTVSIRGAITVEENTREAILENTKLLLKTLIEDNQLKEESLIQVIFAATKDLTKVYPAVAARDLGITEAALLCMQEMYVENSLEKCVRVSVLAQQEGFDQKSVSHTYLKGAKVLRPDLTSK